MTGYELDLKACVCSRYINNIDSFNIDFHHLDLDNEKSILKYETVFLFSVIHHTKNLIENGKKISESSDRIIIECRLKEDGKKPVLKDKRTIWEISSFWNFASIDDLHFYLEELFPFHKVYKNHGKCDKSRYIIELKNNLIVKILINSKDTNGISYLLHKQGMKNIPNINFNDFNKMKNMMLFYFLSIN